MGFQIYRGLRIGMIKHNTCTFSPPNNFRHNIGVTKSLVMQQICQRMFIEQFHHPERKNDPVLPSHSVCHITLPQLYFTTFTFQFEILTGNALLIFKYTNQIVLILASFLPAKLCFCQHTRLQPSPFLSKKNKLCWVMVRFIKIYYLCEGHFPSVMSVIECYLCPP